MTSTQQINIQKKTNITITEYIYLPKKRKNNRVENGHGFYDITLHALSSHSSIEEEIKKYIKENFSKNIEQKITSFLSIFKKTKNICLVSQKIDEYSYGHYFVCTEEELKELNEGAKLQDMNINII